LAPSPPSQLNTTTPGSRATAVRFAPLVSTPHPPRRQAIAIRAVCVTPTGRVGTAVLLSTDSRLAVMGFIAYGSSTTLTMVDLLTVVELTSRLRMWTSTETAEWPNLCATRVACALGYCREMVHGTAVFTGALDTTGNPISLTAAQTAHVRDLT
jgi:hypothetical protein